MSRPFLTAEWRFLAMFNFEIDPAILQPYVPSGTELDAWKGRTYLSLVGFQFLRTRILGLPIPFHRNFTEVNLRFYVRRKAPEGWRRGVAFIKEFVPRTAIALVARWLYNENYVACRMDGQISRPNEEGRQGFIEYSWTVAGERYVLRANCSGLLHPLEPNTEDEFIAEHYWGYVRQRDGSTLEYQVEHTPWRVWRVQSAELHGNMEHCYGRDFSAALTVPASSVLVADGSPVVVHRGRRI